MSVKYVFVLGGVVSGLGKVSRQPRSAVFKGSRLRRHMQKFDPYINVDPGTMNPVQHGEVFVTDDGIETDLDLITSALSMRASPGRATSRQENLFCRSSERTPRRLRRRYSTGHPHITNEIKSRFHTEPESKDTRIAIIEVGGTVGDIESQPFSKPSASFSTMSAARMPLSRLSL